MKCEIYLHKIENGNWVLRTASCKRRDAQRAMRNTNFIGYSMVHLNAMLGKGEYQSLYKESDGRLD